MNRREFCKLGVGSIAAGTSLLALGKAASAGAAKAPGAIDPDALAAEAVRILLPGKKTCGEAMLAAGAKALGVRSELIPDIALGLSGGVGRQGSVCAIVTGASLVISLAAAKKHADYVKKRQAVWDATAKFYKDFEKKFGTVTCRGISGLDLTTKEGMKALAGGVKKNKCGKVIDAAARMLAECLRDMLA